MGSCQDYSLIIQFSTTASIQLHDAVPAAAMVARPPLPITGVRRVSSTSTPNRTNAAVLFRLLAACPNKDLMKYRMVQFLLCDIRRFQIADRLGIHTVHFSAENPGGPDNSIGCLSTSLHNTVHNFFGRPLCKSIYCEMIYLAWRLPVSEELPGDLFDSCVGNGAMMPLGSEIRPMKRTLPVASWSTKNKNG